MLPTYKTAELSTAHITEKDSKLLSQCGVETSAQDTNAIFPVIEYEYGFLIFIPSKEVWKEYNVPQRLKEYDFSNAFTNIIETCMNEGLRQLNLDRDVEPFKDLPTFDW